MIWKLYTDGATSHNGAKDAYGGWGWALYDEDKIAENSGFLANTTNNKCEMTAIIEGCTDLLDRLDEEDIVDVFSDSAYCVNCYKQRWFVNWEKNGWVNAKQEPVKNKELWEELIKFFNDERFNFRKVKGHADDERNNYVDRLAVEAKINGSLRN